MLHVAGTYREVSSSICGALLRTALREYTGAATGAKAMGIEASDSMLEPKEVGATK